MKKTLSISLILIVLDRIIKIVVTNFLVLNQENEIIKNFFYLLYVRNYGAAFSILTGNRLFLIFFSVISLFLIYKYLLKDKILNKKENITYGLLIGGLTGNLIDRIIHGYVIDYLSFKIYSYEAPIFNFADICIVLSALSLVLLIEGAKNEKNI